MIRYVTVTETPREGRPTLFCASQAPCGHGALGYTAEEAIRRVLSPTAILPGDWPSTSYGSGWKQQQIRGAIMRVCVNFSSTNPEA